MAKYLWMVAALMVLVVAGVFVHSWLGHKPHEPEKHDATIRVQVVKPKLGGLERLSSQPATAESWERVDLYSEVTGILTRQEVDINSRVKGGQVLAGVYAPDVLKERQVARALWIQAVDKVKTAEAHLETARARKRAAEKMVKRREAEVIAAKSYLSFREIILNRYTQLASTQTIDTALVAEERDRHDAARYRRDESLLAVSQSQAEVQAKETDIAQADAALEVARADVDVAQRALAKSQVFVDFCEIKAPFDGVITFRSLNNGAFIRAKERGSQVPLLTIKRTDKFRIVTYVPDVDAPYVQKGDPVELKIFTLGMVFPGKVARRALSQDEETRLMRTEVDLENPKGLLQDGMYGELAIHVSNVDKVNPRVVTVPSSCLQDEGQAKERTVYVVQPASSSAGAKAGGRRYRVHVAQVLVGYNQDKGKLNKKTVDRQDLRVEILRGLTPEDTVIEGQVAGLTEGSIVEVKD